jgi:hypothetical protein
MIPQGRRNFVVSKMEKRDPDVVCRRSRFDEGGEVWEHAAMGTAQHWPEAGFKPLPESDGLAATGRQPLRTLPSAARRNGLAEFLDLVRSNSQRSVQGSLQLADESPGRLATGVPVH